MPRKKIVVSASSSAIAAGLERLKSELGVVIEFPEQVLADATATCAQPPLATERIDLTDVDFITIDPEGARDLDQAMNITRLGDGYQVLYAIDDVAAWVRPGSATDQEALKRAQTFYLPGGNALLYPAQIAQGVASLLPQDPPRPAYVWKLLLDQAGVVTSATVEKALVRSRQQLSYPEVQQMLDNGTATQTMQLLREVGQLRIAQEVARGGVSLPIPEQEVSQDESGQWQLEFRSSLPVENWNAQISLMTGMAAASMMVEAKVGILRTLPPVEQGALDRLRRVAQGLHISWPAEQPYAEFLRSLDPQQGTHLAMLQHCTTLFRGASYVAFNGELPAEDYHHSALAALYAHCTAPLRRLVDRYVLEICWCVTHGQAIPQWVMDVLETLPTVMDDVTKREKKCERGLTDLVECIVLEQRVGESFVGTVTEVVPQRGFGEIMVHEPAVSGRVYGKVPLGQEITVTLTKVNFDQGFVTFEVK
ncbi:MAG: RNB domain-containing ribonuclease [Propionibacteriaceae bacterium]